MKNAMTIGCLALFAAGTAFAAPDAIRVTDCCGDVWRIQTAVAPGRFENRGAVQVFKDFLGEKHEDRASAPSRGRVTQTERGDWRVTAPDGRLLAEFGAPVFDDTNARTVYLPAGEWRNELTGETVSVGADGRTVSVKASLAEISSFRKKKVK